MHYLVNKWGPQVPQLKWEKHIAAFSDLKPNNTRDDIICIKTTDEK